MNLPDTSSLSAPSADAAISSATPGLRRHGWKFVVGVLFLFNVIAFVPWMVQLPRAELDISWSMVLQWAWLNGADFGHDLAFTYGPWGFAFQGYSPRTYFLATLINVLVVVPVFYCLYSIATHMSRNRWIAAIWILLVITLAANGFQGLADVRLLIIPWSVLLIYFFLPGRKPWRTEIILLACVLAFLSQVKFTMFIQSAVVLAAVTADQLLRRRAAWPLLGFSVAMLFFWLLSGQRPGSLLPYLRNSWSVSSGYTDGCSLFSKTEVRDVAIYLGFAAMLMSVAVMGHWFPSPASVDRNTGRWKRFLASCRPRMLRLRLETVRAVLVLGTLAATLLLLFKAGYVRHDGHELLATVGGSVLLMLLSGAVWPSQSSVLRRGAIGVVVACGLANYWFSQHRWINLSLPGSICLTASEVPSRVGSMLSLARGTDPNFKPFTLTVEKARSIRSLPVPSGTTDIYSVTQQGLLSRDYNYRPRPVFQSYTAYTARLAEMNAAFLRSAKAPESILFGTQPIDNHLPSMEDSLSWPELLTRYDLVDGAHSHLLLRKAAAPRQIAFTEREVYNVPFSHVIKLPDSDLPIWAKLTLKKNLKARLVGPVYKIPNTYLVVKTKNGMERTFRILPEIAAAGFLLSPIIADQSQFMMLYSKDLAQHADQDRVAELAIGGAPGSNLESYFEPEYTFEISKLQFPQSDISAIPGVAGYLEVKKFLQNCTIAFQQAPVIPHCTEEGNFVSVSAGFTQLLYVPPEGAKTLSVGFGMVQQSYTGTASADPIEKLVYALAPDGKGGWAGEVIYSRKLDPSHVEADRGFHSVKIQLPNKVFTTIMLETGPAVHGSLSYWSVPHFSAE